MSRIVILGGGESGTGAAVLAKVKGFDVFLSDKGEIAPEYAAMLEKWDIPYESGQHTEEKILKAFSLEGLELVSAIALGHPASIPAPRPRKAKEDIIR